MSLYLRIFLSSLLARSAALCQVASRLSHQWSTCTVLPVFTEASLHCLAVISTSSFTITLVIHFRPSHFFILIAFATTLLTLCFCH